MRKPRTHLVALLSNAAAVLVSAIAAGLAAHLLGTDFFHDGSSRDLMVLGADMIAAFFIFRNLRSNTGMLVTLALASTCVAVGWLFLEDPAHVQSAQIVSTAVSLVPTLCALIFSVFLFASASVVLVQAIVDLALAVLSRNTGMPYRYDFFAARSFAKIKDTRLRMFSRRGPPTSSKVILLDA